MGQTPDELVQEIDVTRQHLTEVAAAIGGRLETAVQATRRKVSPRYLIADHPATSLQVAFFAGFLVGSFRWR
jgi:hypothetical protein